MSRIIVAGSGHGGITAAMLLAKEGHSVTVYEKCSKGECTHDQKDSFDAAALEYAGIPIPEEYYAPSNQLTFVPLDDEVEPITLPVNENYRNLTVDRREFHAYLTSLAEEAGVEFVYDTEILAPIMLGSRVAGIKTGKGDFYGDLIIDACGAHSPVRKNLPDFCHIDREPAEYEILHAWRASFDRTPGVPDPEHKYSLYIKEDNGFRWAVTSDNDVDVLLIRFTPLTYADVAEGLRIVSGYNPQMGKKMLSGGKFAEIPVRQPAAVFVADGYAAVGDSAFMTYAVKGSGIAYAVKAGKMLADAVKADEEGLYNVETLWEYEARFYKEIGYSACRIAIAKNLVTYMTAEEVNDIFRDGIITTEELNTFVMGDYSKSKVPGMIMDKVKMLGDIPVFRAHLMNLLGWFGRFTSLEPFFPEKYSRENLVKWSERYNRFFESIRRKDEE